MRKIRQPAVIATLLLGATLVLVGGTIAAASRPSSEVFWARTHPSADTAAMDPAATSSASKKPTAKVVPSAPTPSATTSPATKPKRSKSASITYTVKRGDTLSIIAAWFKQHGYGALYEANKSVIGSDPNRIFPGQRITISKGGMTLHR